MSSTFLLATIDSTPHAIQFGVENLVWQSFEKSLDCMGTPKASAILPKRPKIRPAPLLFSA